MKQPKRTGPRPPGLAVEPPDETIRRCLPGLDATFRERAQAGERLEHLVGFILDSDGIEFAGAAGPKSSREALMVTVQVAAEAATRCEARGHQHEADLLRAPCPPGWTRVALALVRQGREVLHVRRYRPGDLASLGPFHPAVGDA